MGKRRMFSLDVIDTDHFLDMPTSTQALYFHLGMHGDDDGFVGSPRKITAASGCNNDDLKLLITKGYVILFNSGVIVITDWSTNNTLRNDRYRPTKYANEKAMLQEKAGRYVMRDTGIPLVDQMTTTGIPLVDQMDPQLNLTKQNITKQNKDICPEPEDPAPDRSGILLPLVDGTSYDVPMSMISMWESAYPAVDIRQELGRMVSWLACNPTRRKTRRGIERFINSWLSRAQDQGGKYRTGQQEPVEESEEPREYRDDVERYAQYLGDLPGPDDPFQ